MKGISVFPVRHHSPASSLLICEFIKNINPKLILIEGPSDANHLLDILTDAETEPPVAILAYYLASLKYYENVTKYRKDKLWQVFYQSVKKVL
jgi:hypothetical protein